MGQIKKLIIELFSVELNCIAVDMVVEAENAETLLDILGISPGQLNPSTRYEIDAAELPNLERLLNVSLPTNGYFYRLRGWHPLDNLPYKVHTNRELKMMLEKIKPLAVFSEDYPSEHDFEMVPEKYFAKYVEDGVFVKREYIVVKNSLRNVRYVLYALPEESWRIDAYVLLQSASDKSGWSKGFERMEGSLLGYEDWQNDAYLEIFYKKR